MQRAFILVFWTFLALAVPMGYAAGGHNPLPQLGAHYGHLPYDSVSKTSLVRFDGYLLHPETANAWQAMKQSAREEGVRLQLASAFRSEKYQHYLFHTIAKRRGQTLTERAVVSAPPGHSEHHTGLAIDIIDADHPTGLTEAFATTPAGEWLMNNAQTFGFELSFPPSNPQGIAFEPWHWRFIGSDAARRTFAPARLLLAE